MEIVLGLFKTRKRRGGAPPFSSPAEMAKSGWGAFMLEPGTYYLRITSESADRQEMFEPVPEFRFVVSPNTPLLYIGL